MNAREQMQALVDGKTIMCEGNKFKLDDDGDLVQYSEYGEVHWSKVGGGDFVIVYDSYVVDESKCVDFAHAIGMMAQGKVMKCLWSNSVFRIADGALQTCETGWISIAHGKLLNREEIESMWMEVPNDEIE